MIRWFGENRWSLDSLTPPWGALGSIYQQIQQGVMEPLPDEGVVFSGKRIKWVGGAMDGVFGSEARSPEAEERVSKMVAAVRRLQRNADNKTLRELYELVAEGALTSCIDQVLNELSKSNTDNSRVLQIGRYFAREAGHREAVKFGLALIGTVGAGQDLEMVRTLGKHEEFTLFAAVALARLSENREQALWELAKNVHGWGRIQIVTRLKNTQDAEIHSWMLREGFRNNVMNEYLACICARTGRMHEALQGQFVDDPLLDGAADIIRALIRGGPAEGIEDYEFAADACESYINIVWSRPDAGLKHFLAVATLRDFLKELSQRKDGELRGWSDSCQKNMRALADEIFSRNCWRALIENALRSNEEKVFFEGDQAAQFVLMDTWEIHFDRVKTDSLGSSSWYRLMIQTDESRIEQVLNFAESVLPFDQIETGPADELGLGLEFKAHGALDWILQDLRRFPGRGWRMIKAGLASPVVRNRNMAIQALAAWPLESWSMEMKDFVQGARGAEPRQEVRKRIESLLAGTPPS
jgi:hypothetical protein